jgi:uncharacterized protein
MDAVELTILFLAGSGAGFINTLAGGGSLLTIPALLLVGVPSTLANATNRVAVVMQSVVGAAQFHRRKVYTLSESLPMLLPVCAGTVVGAVAAARMDEGVFDIVLGVVLVAVLVTLFYKPSRKAPQRPAPRWVAVPVFFLIGLYGGFIQTGVGFLLISGISMVFRFDLIKTNALKLLVVALYSFFALAVFAWYGQVLWLYGLVLGLGNVTGVLLGVRFAVRRGAEAVRWIVMAAVVLSALKLFGLIG